MENEAVFYSLWGKNHLVFSTQYCINLIYRISCESHKVSQSFIIETICYFGHHFKLKNLFYPVENSSESFHRALSCSKDSQHRKRYENLNVIDSNRKCDTMWPMNELRKKKNKNILAARNESQKCTQNVKKWHGRDTHRRINTIK